MRTTQVERQSIVQAACVAAPSLSPKVAVVGLLVFEVLRLGWGGWS